MNSTGTPPAQPSASRRENAVKDYNPWADPRAYEPETPELRRSIWAGGHWLFGIVIIGLLLLTWAILAAAHAKNNDQHHALEGDSQSLQCLASTPAPGPLSFGWA